MLLVGCGRLGFEPGTGSVDANADAALLDADALPVDAGPSACVPTTVHDEDGDLLVDDCDPCPLRADDGADQDADGVGDACDPWPASAERIVLFDPFTLPRPEWMFDSVPEFRIDEIRMDGTGGAISGRTLPAPGREMLELVGRGKDLPVGDYAAALEIGASAGPERYGCEVGVVAGVRRLAFTFTLDGIVYTAFATAVMNTPLASNDVRLTLELTPPNVRCEAVVDGEYATASGQIPTGIPAEMIRMTARGFELEVDGFVRAGAPL